MNDLIAFGIQIGTLLPLVAIAALISRRLNKTYLAAVVAFAFVDFCLIVYVSEIPWLDFKALSWNWVGKAASLLFSTSMLWFVPGLRHASGVVLEQRKGSLVPCSITLILLIATAVCGGLQNGKQPFRLETLLFQLTMPSISEELVFRGIMLHFLNAALGKTDNPTLRSMGWAVPVIVIWFGLGHSVYWAGNSLHISWFLLFFTGGVGAALMYMRLVSGSILFPMIGHTLFNLTITAVPTLR